MSITRLALAFFTLLLTEVAVANSQPTPMSKLDSLLGTTHTQFMPLMQDGKLNGCTMTFTALVQDYAYNVGGYLKLTGNVGMLITDVSIGANVKLLVHSLDFEKQQLVSRPSPPSRVYLIKSDFQNTAKLTLNTFPAEDPGGIFVVMEAAKTMPFLEEIFTTSKIGIAFNQSNGKTDLTTEIDFSVLDIDDNGIKRRGRETVDKFSKCMLSVVNNAGL